jgi:penicillin G amidase
VLNDVLADLPAGFPTIALRRDEALGEPISSLRWLYRATDHRSASLTLASLDAMPGHWVIADGAGDIAYQSSGRIPKRHAHRGTFPAPGWLARYDWDGWISGEALPRVSNPPSSMIATANNQVVSPNALGYPFNDEGDADWRSKRIGVLFDSGGPNREPLEFNRALHTDCIEPFFAALLPVWERALRAVAADRDADMARAAEMLLRWDGACGPESAVASLFHGVCVQLLCANLQGEAPPATLAFIRSYLNAEPLMFWVLTTRAIPGWNSDALIAEALRAALRSLRRRHGPQPRDWPWHKVAPFVLKHPFGGKRLFARYFNRGPLPTRGSHNALNKQYVSRAAQDSFPVLMAAALRINIDLGDLPASTMCVAGGQSGRPGSQHYDDLLPCYLDGTGAGMTMDFDEICLQAQGMLTLVPWSKEKGS